MLDWGVEDVLAVRVSDVLLLQMRHLHTDYRDKADLKLETIRVHDLHSHIGGRMYDHKSAPEVGGFSRPGSGSICKLRIWWAELH